MKNKIVFKTAKINDIKALIHLENICFQSDRLHIKQFRHFIQSKTAYVFIAEEKNNIIANAVVLMRKNSKIVRLYSLAVDPTRQHHGIGRSLCDYVENLLIKKRYTEIRLEVRKDNRRAIRFYQKSGYQIFGESIKYYEDGEDALRMRKPLSTNPKQREIGID